MLIMGVLMLELATIRISLSLSGMNMHQTNGALNPHSHTLAGKDDEIVDKFSFI